MRGILFDFDGVFYIGDAPVPVLVALDMTRYWRAPDGLRLDVGAYVSALKYASGKGRGARQTGRPFL